MRERARQALALVATSERHAPLEPDVLVSELSPAEAELVAIARALVGECRVLILDEPTSSLDRDDVERLFGVVRELASRGISVLYVSHFLDEVMRIADRYTVLRDGRVVGTGAMAEARTADLVACMAGGRGVPERAEAKRAAAPGETVLELEKLAGLGLPVSASLELRRGEVLGIGGLVGSGRTELMRAIFGLDQVRSGRIRVGAAWGPASPVHRLGQGLGLLSEDRTGEGLMLARSVASNLTLSRLPPWILPRTERRAADDLIARLGIRCRGPEQVAWELSGGNQQKVALGRLLYHDLDILLLDEPTRGIDVVSRAEVHELVRELCRHGKAVLVVSSYWPELLELCDRIAVMRRGVLGPARRAADWNENTLLAEAMGA
jgi:ribose transport system ATP-binding protein